MDPIVGEVATALPGFVRDGRVFRRTLGNGDALAVEVGDGAIEVAVVVTPWLAWLRQSDDVRNPRAREGAVRERVGDGGVAELVAAFLPLLDRGELLWRLRDDESLPGSCPRVAVRAALAADAGDEATARRDADEIERHDPALAEWVRESIRTLPRAVAVVLRRQEILVIKRHFRGRDYAVLPGGGVEAGETFEQAAERELWEETTMRGRAGRELLAGEHRGRRARYFLMAEVTGEPRLSGPELDDHSPENSFELMWATTADFAALNLVPAHLRTDLPPLIDGE